MSGLHYHLRLFPTGRLEVPAPQIYWMRRFAEWVQLERYPEGIAA